MSHRPRRRMRLAIVNDDMPFLVDSVSMALGEMGVGVHVLGHPLVRFTRDRAGKVTAVGEGKHESLMLLEIDRLPDLLTQRTGDPLARLGHRLVERLQVVDSGR